MTPKSISAIIVTYHTGSVLFDSLSALKKDNIDEIIIINNGNDFDTIRKLVVFCKADKRVKLIDPKANLGFGKACNLGAKQANGDILLFLNPDAIIHSNVSDIIINDLRDNSIFGGLILDKNNKEQQGARRGRLTIFSAIISFLGLAQSGADKGILRDFNQNNEPLPKNMIEVDNISGAFFAMYKNAFWAINGFDEGYFLHLEDVDLCTRFKKIGGKIWFAPKLIATHIGGTSKSPKTKIEYYKFLGFLRYFWKNYHGLGKILVILIAPFLALAMIARIIL